MHEPDVALIAVEHVQYMCRGHWIEGVERVEAEVRALAAHHPTATALLGAAARVEAVGAGSAAASSSPRSPAEPPEGMH